MTMLKRSLCIISDISETIRELFGHRSLHWGYALSNPLLSSRSVNAQRILRNPARPQRHILPSLRVSSAPYKIKMLRPLHWLLTPGVNGRNRRRQKHILLDLEFRQMIITPGHILRMLHDTNHLAHMPVIFVIAGAIKDRGPSLVGQLGRVGEQPVEFRFWGTHACICHQEDSARVLEEPAFLGGGERGLGAEDGGIYAGGYRMQEEEIEFALVWRVLCSSGEIDLSPLATHTTI